MAILQFSQFEGEKPRIAPENLPDTAASRTLGAALYSGDLEPFRGSAVIAEHEDYHTIDSLHLLKELGTFRRKFVGWTSLTLSLIHI